MSEEVSGNKKSGGVIKYFFWLIVIMIVAGVGSFLYLTDKGMSMTKDTILEVVRGFKPKRVINGFNEWRELQVKGTEGNILEVATGEESVELSRESSVEMFGKTVPLVTASSKIIVPATFRYHIDLLGQWDMIEKDNRLYVIAPPLKPSLPIAFDSTKMEKINGPGWAKFISSANMNELEKTITPELQIRAEDPENIKLYEEEAKKSIAKFLQTWLSFEGAWANGKFEEIIVFFEGDVVDTEAKEVEPHATIEIPQPELN
ncbi:MAG: hypothetical protein P1V20_19465 [Verrucomicrobiales bacterium]|nr:hypothetical protein [Verrucomicrobiales bacterium]